MTTINKGNPEEDGLPEDILGKLINEFEDEIEEEPVTVETNSKKRNNPQNLLDELVKTYFDSKPYIKSSTINKELEVRFGTRGIRHFTKNDYDNVIKKLKSFGFSSTNENGFYSLRIQNEFLDKNTGRFKLSNIRVEINGLNEIKDYCGHNDIKKILEKGAHIVKFTKKMSIKNAKGEYIRPVNMDDFNFRVSYQDEEESFQINGINRFIVDNWHNSKKTFRYLNRVTFKHPNYPIQVDISIVKNSRKEGREYQKTYTTEESGVFENPESYEIELEVNNREIGPGTNVNNYGVLLENIRKIIKFILSGLQGTNYPVSYSEQNEVIQSYMKMLYKDDYDPNKRVYPSHFIGPSSTVLKRKNIVQVDENSLDPNIRKSYTVTEKADGDRHLMYISGTGKIYLINTNMNVIFTGAVTEEKTVFHSLLDGELILHDKNGKFINCFAAFDFYYLNKEDIRSYIFMPTEKEQKKCRYSLLKQLIKILKPISIINRNHSSPLRIENKKFYPSNFDVEKEEESNIFGACENILSKIHSDLFEYNTDGLIFTPAFLGVGSSVVGKAGPLKKITWEHSFKWKPPQYNTIDFLVTTVKATNGVDDIVKSIFEDGTNVLIKSQLNEYKTIVLRCTFIEDIHGYINPCQDVIDDILPEYKCYEDDNSKKAKPVQFYPTNPYDPNAGICNIMLKNDDNNTKQMFSEENEVFTDNTIVEFRYDFSREKGWRWIPLRVRYDKTAELRQGFTNFGNAYHVANSNWQSIHSPITEDMIRTGLNIPTTVIDDDVYYNKTTGGFKTKSMKDFHNLYVKRILIDSVSKKGDTLIDYACGKGGDLPKWIHAQLSFVFGIDISRDNLENRLDGACARFLNYRKKNKNMPYALFVNGNSAYNIRNGAAMLNDKAAQICKAVFGSGSKDEDQIGKGVARQYGKGQEGFQISSCQFAIHYFFENITGLKGFLQNISECTKLGGYFIGTSYDGKIIFNLLKNKAYGESIEIVEDGKKIWEITKGYKSNHFEDESSSIGYRIDVYQESINHKISEYLVNYDYFNRVMEDYGFKLIDENESKALGLPEGSGLFSKLYANMEEEIKKNKFRNNDYGEAMSMNSFEKKISFLNRYFVYKKIRNVNASKVKIEVENILEENEGNEDYEERIEKINLTDEIKIKKNINKSKSLNIVHYENQESEQKPEQEKIVFNKPKKEVKRIKKLDKKILLLSSSEPKMSETIELAKEAVVPLPILLPEEIYNQAKQIITTEKEKLPKEMKRKPRVKKTLIIEEK